VGTASSSTGPPLAATIAATRRERLVNVQEIAYASRDGSRVPALLAIPQGIPPRGCLIWEDGLGSRKEDSAFVWQGAAQIGLATFSIDLRDHGERAVASTPLSRVVREPAALAALVRGTVSDLERGVDYLETRPECAHNIGYAGLSLGGIIGTVFAAMDKRVRVAVLMSTPPTWRALVTSTDEILPGVVRSPTRLRAALRILAPLDPDAWIGQIAPRPLLLLSGRSDTIVPPHAARALQAAARRPKTVVTYDGGHIPFVGPDATSNEDAIAAFLLSRLSR
jgi:pimeloyl-ACP methyl ester carboxylesterase